MHITESSFGDKTIQLQDKAIIIGCSINNSYFKEENIGKLIDWACDHSLSTYIMIPDEPMVHTLMAFGYAEVEARRKVRLKTNALRNLCHRVIGDRCVRVITWSDVIPSLQYLVGLGQIIALFNQDENFKKEMYKMTNEVIVANGAVPSTEALNHGVQFLIKELAFITHSDLILNEDKTIYVYHKTMELLKDMLLGKYLLDIGSNVNFLTIS